MSIPPVEKACIRCGKHFVGRKNRVFCSEICRSETGNERLMNAYRAQRGTVDKYNKVNYTNNNPSNNKDKSNNSINVDNLIAENKRLSLELAQLKQAITAQAAPPQHANTSGHTNGSKPSDSSDVAKAAKLSAMKDRAAQVLVLMKKEAEELGLTDIDAQKKADEEPTAEEMAAMKVKAKALTAKLKKLKFTPTKKKKS